MTNCSGWQQGNEDCREVRTGSKANQGSDRQAEAESGLACVNYGINPCILSCDGKMPNGPDGFPPDRPARGKGMRRSPATDAIGPTAIR
jgi:hypothetical protein